MPFWKDDWDVARKHLTGWWEHRDCALSVTAPKDIPWERIERPVSPSDLETAWTDPLYRTRLAESQLSRTFFGGEAFPYADVQIGPGSLGLFLGCEAGYAPDTVWYEPCIAEPESHAPLRFDPENTYFREHMALIDEALRIAQGRFIVGMPDLIENLDTLAQLRGPQTLMMDLIERPDWCLARIEEINDAYFIAFDALYNRIETPWGGNAFAAFKIWGPGKTAKVQCDALAMISPTMFREFVRPSLTAQAEWLDYSMFHLDGTQCFVHLDSLMEIDAVDAIEWTPQAGIEGGGDPRWYDLYRRILAAGKSVQAIGVKPEEVLPLFDAVGHEGVFVMVEAESEDQATRLVQSVRGY